MTRSVRLESTFCKFSSSKHLCSYETKIHMPQCLGQGSVAMNLLLLLQARIVVFICCSRISCFCVLLWCADYIHSAIRPLS